MEADERFERLAICLEALRLENDETAVLVEGQRDVDALRRLGLEGEILVYNAGKPLGAFADDLARSRAKVIVLLDWDRTGGHLVRRFTEHLQGLVTLDLSFRKELAIVSQVRSVEDLPAALTLLRDRAGQGPRHGADG